MKSSEDSRAPEMPKPVGCSAIVRPTVAEIVIGWLKRHPRTALKIARWYFPIRSLFVTPYLLLKLFYKFLRCHCSEFRLGYNALQKGFDVPAFDFRREVLEKLFNLFKCIHGWCLVRPKTGTQRPGAEKSKLETGDDAPGSLE